MEPSLGVVVLTSLTAYLLALYYLGRAHEISRYTALSFLAVAVYGIVVEASDIRSTHSYYYAELLVMFGTRPEWVPLAIGCSWATIIFVVMRTSDLLAPPWWQRPLLDGALAVSLDLLIDPVSSNSRWVDALGESCVGAGEPFGGIGVWTWCVPYGDQALWFNIPLNNFFLWFALVVTASYAIRIGSRVLRAEERSAVAQTGILAVVLLGAFGALWAALTAYAQWATDGGVQRAVIAGTVLGPVALMLVQVRRLRFDNPFGLGLLVAPLWMFASGIGGFLFLRIAGAEWPGAVVLIFATTAGSVLLFLSPYLGSLARRTPSPAPPGPEAGRRKVAILGGGVGGIVAAFELTQPHLRGKYDVTVYQLGWRIGGKGASGRNPEVAERIEEHGIHFWSGVYENAFRAMRVAYDELDRPPGTPLAGWRDAFKPMAGPMSVMEYYGGEWVPWTLSPVTNDQAPGDPDAHLLQPFWSYVGEAIQLIRRWFRHSHGVVHAHRKAGSGALGRAGAHARHAVATAVVEGGGTLLHGLYLSATLSHRVLATMLPRGVRGLADSIAHAAGGLAIALIRLAVRIHWRSVRRHLQHTDARIAWTFLNLGVGVLHGLHRDDVVKRGFDSIDHLDFRDWLGRHIVPDPVTKDSPYDNGGPRDRSLTLESPVAMLLYNSDFAFEDGDTRKPRLAAGVAAYTLLRLGVTAKGAPLWAMQAGMGDTVFTPFYRVLRKRGVKFEFFRKVKALHVSADGASIGAVTIARQAELAEGRTTYEPLVDVKDLECWPSVPHWDQLENGAKYEADGVDFEEWCSPELGDFQIRVGEDYDVLVLGISLGAFPYVCTELIEARSEWRAMVGNLARVRTVSTQLWLDKTALDLGWTEVERSPSVSCYDTSCFDVWFDLSHLIEREAWASTGSTPRSLAYINGCMPSRVPRIEPQSCEELRQHPANDASAKRAVEFLEKQAYRIYKAAAAPGRFDWDRLIDTSVAPSKGPARIHSQYSRTNVQPSELYVQSLPGTGRYRMHPSKSGFANLVLAGDWTWNSFQAGCVEGATISGMLASHAISGSPPLDGIVGLTFGHIDTPYGRPQPRR